MTKLPLTAASAALLALAMSGPARAADFIDLSSDDYGQITRYYDAHPVRERVEVEDDSDAYSSDELDDEDSTDEVVRVGAPLPDAYAIRPLPAELHTRIRAYDRFGTYTADDDDTYVVETTTRRVVKRIR